MLPSDAVLEVYRVSAGCGIPLRRVGTGRRLILNSYSTRGLRDVNGLQKGDCIDLKPERRLKRNCSVLTRQSAGYEVLVGVSFKKQSLRG